MAQQTVTYHCPKCGDKTVTFKYDTTQVFIPNAKRCGHMGCRRIARLKK